MGDYPDIDHCDCHGQGTTMVNAMPACDPNSRLCPNQVGRGANDWDSAIATTLPPKCPTELPHLPYFEACGLTTFKLTKSNWEHWIEEVNVYTLTLCTCNKVGETGTKASSYVLSTVTRHCDGGYLCHNSDGFVEGKPKVTKRELERGTTAIATATGPLLAVTTEATPGSAPTPAAEPTVLMAE